MYKMITIDVDDTLINDEKVVTPATMQALEEAIKQGVLVTLATGRMFASAKKIAAQLQLNVPLITYQGAYVKNLLDEAVLYERSLPAPFAKQLYDYAMQHNLHIQIYCHDELFVQHDNDKVIGYSQASDVPYTVQADLKPLLEQPIHKILFIDEPAYLDDVASTLSAQFGNDVHVTKSKPYFLEFLHPEGTKGHAVRFLAQHFGFELSEVIAIGDSWNDHEMLEVAGLGVAMDNAVDSLKQIADYVTHSNNKEGVKHVIEKFILNA